MHANYRRYIVPSVLLLTLVIDLAVILSNYLQQTHEAVNLQSGFRISAVAHPFLFFPLGQSQVCLAAIWMGAGSGKWWHRVVLLIGTVYLWGMLREFFAAERYATELYVLTASFIYGGLICYRLCLARNKHFETHNVAGNKFQFQIRHLLFAFAWTAILVTVEKDLVSDFGWLVLLRFCIQNAFPPAIMSLLLYWAISQATTVRTLIAYSAIALAVGVGAERLFSQHPSALHDTLICGLIISVWLLSVRATKTQDVST